MTAITGAGGGPRSASTARSIGARPNHAASAEQRRASSSSAIQRRIERRGGCAATERRRRSCVSLRDVENRADRAQLGGQRRRRFVALIEALRQRLADDRVELGRQRRLIDEGAGAAACTICSASAVDVAPVNGSLPVSISNSTMPSEKMSVR